MGNGMASSLQEERERGGGLVGGLDEPLPLATRCLGPPEAPRPRASRHRQIESTLGTPQAE